MNKLLGLTSFLFLTSCATAHFRIETEPANAEVQINNKVVGMTPLDIKPEMNPEAFAKPLLSVKISKPGFESQNVFVDSGASQTLNFNLTAYTAEYFKERMLLNFSRQVNGLSRGILEIQGFIASGKFPVAQERLNNFMKEYPNVASAYVLQATLDLENKNPTMAFKNLQRALTLDPDDAVAARLVERLKKERGSQ
ncbi:hypothetical protein AZI86_10715 [Bdellovibrio bacteriovorus]|uniref:PEGA domain-containing protein n=1 Tax=Bdellovibrio bacteriovorus TaxID=959 RepID=A0A150WLG7_BDEBC|nr:PEGA domain-containing protein [Bdellovibrio bacteriovorus]KYG64675.1 hypothetical protein AZI86_10715 [Bdellovibrio bacteriovorus]